MQIRVCKCAQLNLPQRLNLFCLVYLDAVSQPRGLINPAQQFSEEFTAESKCFRGLLSTHHWLQARAVPIRSEGPPAVFLPSSEKWPELDACGVLCLIQSRWACPEKKDESVNVTKKASSPSFSSCFLFEQSHRTIPPTPSLKSFHSWKLVLWRTKKVLAELVAENSPGHSHLFALTANSFKHGPFQVVEATPVIFLLLLDSIGHQVKVDGRRSSLTLGEPHSPTYRPKPLEAKQMFCFLLFSLTSPFSIC